PLQPGPVLGCRPRPFEGDPPARPEQSGRRGLGGPVDGALRHPWHARTVQHRQDPVARLHPPDQLGRAGVRLGGRPGHADGAATVKGLLPFVAGLLVGANLVYFLMRDRAPAAAPAATAPAATTPASTTTPAPERPPAVDSTVPTAEDARRATASKPPRRAVDLPRDALLIPVRGVRPTELQDTFDDL